MQSKIAKRLKMIRRTEQLLSENQALFGGDLRFQELHSDLQSRMTSIEQMLDEWQRLNIPLGATKKVRKNEFNKQLLLLGDLLSICLKEKGDTENLEHLRRLRPQIVGSTDIKRIEYAEVLLLIAEEYRAELEKYSKGKSLLEDATASLDAYRLYNEKPLNNRSENSIRRLYLYDAIEDVSRMIQSSFRVFVKTYQADFPEFHDQFMAFSKIGYSSVNANKLSHDEGDTAATTEGETQLSNQMAAKNTTESQKSVNQGSQAPPSAKIINKQSAQKIQNARKQSKMKRQAKRQSLKAS
jgi:hypothetical protein